MYAVAVSELPIAAYIPYAATIGAIRLYSLVSDILQET